METVKLIVDLMDGSSYRKVISYDPSEVEDVNDVIAKWVKQTNESGTEISSTHKYYSFTEQQLDLPALEV